MIHEFDDACPSHYFHLVCLHYCNSQHSVETDHAAFASIVVMKLLLSLFQLVIEFGDCDFCATIQRSNLEFPNKYLVAVPYFDVGVPD